jgi:hypothetical protein
MKYLYRLSLPDNIGDWEEREAIDFVFKAINDFKHTNPIDLDPWECNFWVQVAVNVSGHLPDDDLLEFYRQLLGVADKLFGVEVLSDSDRRFWNLFAILYLTWTGVWPQPRKLLMQCGHFSTAVYSLNKDIKNATPNELIDYCSACSLFTKDAERIKQVESLANEINGFRATSLSSYSNRYSGKCKICGSFVAAQKGRITKSENQWNLSCLDC